MPMHRLLLIFLLALISARLTAGDATPSSPADGSIPKPVTTIRYMDSIYVTRPHLALQMLDSLRRWSDANGYQQPATRTYVNIVTCLANATAGQWRPARYYAQEAVASARTEGDLEHELMAICQLCPICHQLGDEEAMAYWAQELMKRNAETLNCPWYEFCSDLFYANALRMRGDLAKAWQCLQKLIASLEGAGIYRLTMEFEVMPAAASLLGEMKRHDEAIALLEKACLYARQPNDPRESDEQGRAQGLMYYYGCLMNHYLATGRALQAERCYSLYQELSARFNGFEREGYLPGKYLMKAHRYSEAEAYARRHLQHRLQAADSISEDTKACITLLADACLAQNRQAEAAAFYRRALTLADSLAMRASKQAYMEYSLMSELKDYENTISRQKAQLHRSKVTIGFSVAVGFLLLAVFWMGLKQMRRQRRFNHQLREENRLKQQAEDELKHLKEVMQARNLPANAAPAADLPQTIAESFDELHQWLLEENRFIRPDMDIEKAARHCGLGRREFAERCVKYKGQPFNEYLADMRLAYACQRLMDEDFPTIETVAQESGFSVSTFLRRFKAKYDMSPTDWRNLKGTLSHS